MAVLQETTVEIAGSGQMVPVKCMVIIMHRAVPGFQSTTIDTMPQRDVNASRLDTIHLLKSISDYNELVENPLGWPVDNTLPIIPAGLHGV